MSPAAKWLTAGACALALLCLLAITAMTFSANQSRKDVAGQDLKECIDQSQRFGLNATASQTCIDRFHAGAK